MYYLYIIIQNQKTMTAGGKRQGSGRKKAADPMQQVVIFTQASRILVIGKDKIKEIAKAAVEFEYLRLQP